MKIKILSYFFHKNSVIFMFCIIVSVILQDPFICLQVSVSDNDKFLIVAAKKSRFNFFIWLMIMCQIIILLASRTKLISNLFILIFCDVVGYRLFGK